MSVRERKCYNISDGSRVLLKNNQQNTYLHVKQNFTDVTYICSCTICTNKPQHINIIFDLKYDYETRNIC